MLFRSIGYFMIGPDHEKRALHDRLADTRVVYYHVREVEIPPTVVYRERAPIYSNGPMQGQMVNEQKSDF